MSIFTIEIENLNETFIRINTNNPAVYDALSEKFAFEVPGARFMPSYQDGSWDGWIRLFHYGDRTIYKGLGKQVVELLKSEDFGKVTFRGFSKKNDITADFEEVEKFVRENLPSHIDPYDYQIESALEMLHKRRALAISPTSSGKSFIIYLMTSFIISQLEYDEKILLIVPSITLVDQMYDDFKDYGYQSDAHLILGGTKKDGPQKLYISTWQSIQKQPASWFRQFGGVIVDEVHGATAKSLKSSVEKCTNAVWRYGFTGTLSELETDEIVLRGLFGEITQVTTYEEMRELGIIPEVDIEMIRVRYGDRFKTVCKALKGEFQDELAFIQSEEARDEILLAIARENFDKNGIFLFKSIKHLQRIEQLFRRMFNRPIVIINGGVGRDIRAEIRRQIDKDANVGIRGVILLATYGTMSTGVSIKNLDYGVFAAPMKSKIKVLQSLGRLLRKSDSKKSARLHDVWDDISEYTKADNYGKAHAKSRLRFYKEAGFKVIERIHKVE
ncbi:putative helicase [Sinorhizobium phage phiM9]|uniref:Putative helicase n=1 Tax=Sinorhizobium phage phiM9 TaxID=1636182 RepID=A0A0F6R5T7_9CAUD|nr:putative helicase [Sinorhizobium phage phiM9]AKE44705.1 putative helicase [Sinorhizobium phage phiM9]